MKKHFLDTYEELIHKIRTNASSDKIHHDIMHFLLEVDAMIEAEVSVIDKLRYWKESSEKDARELNILKQSVQRERKEHASKEEPDTEAH